MAVFHRTGEKTNNLFSVDRLTLGKMQNPIRGIPPRGRRCCDCRRSRIPDHPCLGQCSCAGRCSDLRPGLAGDVHRLVSLSLHPLGPTVEDPPAESRPLDDLSSRGRHLHSRRHCRPRRCVPGGQPERALGHSGNRDRHEVSASECQNMALGVIAALDGLDCDRLGAADRRGTRVERRGSDPPWGSLLHGRGSDLPDQVAKTPTQELLLPRVVPRSRGHGKRPPLHGDLDLRHPGDRL